MADSPCLPALVHPDAPALDTAAADAAARLRAMVEEHYDFVWRTLRHLGFRDAAAEDGAQQVMCVLARRFNDVVPGAERAFLFSTAVRVAATLRRTARRHPELAGEELETVAAPTPGVEELVDERRGYEVLQRILDAMPFDLRVVFLLHELEELSSPEVAATLGIPLGTATSRLRKAREAFQASARRLQAGRRGRGE